MHPYLTVSEVEGVPALCAPSDEERELRSRRKATKTPEPADTEIPDTAAAEEGTPASSSSQSRPTSGR
jgi:hypothetical protein